MTEVSPETPGTSAGGGLEESAQLQPRRAITGAAPDKQPARQMVQLMITGDHPVINYISQHAADSGTNVTVAGGAAAGAHGSVAGGQSVQAARDAVAVGQDVAVPGVGEQPVTEGWWARLRKRGAIVAFATIIGALAGIAGVIIAIMVAAGWAP